MPWATLSVLFGRDVNVMANSHGVVHMNAPLRVYTYISW